MNSLFLGYILFIFVYKKVNHYYFSKLEKDFTFIKTVFISQETKHC